MIGYSGVGTGAAGIYATAKLLAARAAGVPNYVLFLAELPSFVIYYLTFKWLDGKVRVFKERVADELR